MRQLRQLEWNARRFYSLSVRCSLHRLTALPSFIVRSASVAANPGRHGGKGGKTDE